MVTQEQLVTFCNETYWEFYYLTDYIWKFNLKIDELRTEEEEKLEAYHPNDFQGQMVRWYFQSKLLDYFPVALHYSFIVSVFLAIEVRLMKTCDLISESKGLSVRYKDVPGEGFKRYKSFLAKHAGIHLEKLPLWPQISNLALVRNCIVHTSGFLEYSRDNEALRSMIKKRSYFIKDDVGKIEKGENENTRPIHIEQTENGDRLIIEFDYSHTIGMYGQKFLMQVFQESGIPFVEFPPDPKSG